MAPTVSALQFKSPLHKMTQTTSTCLWNDSAAIDDLTYSIDHGAVGATCNPSIAVSVLKKEMAAWKPRILELAAAEPKLTEDDLSWRIVEEISANAARLLCPSSSAKKGATDACRFKPIRATTATAGHARHRPSTSASSRPI